MPVSISIDTRQFTRSVQSFIRFVREAEGRVRENNRRSAANRLSVTRLLAELRSTGIRIGNERGRALIRFLSGEELNARQQQAIVRGIVVGTRGVPDRIRGFGLSYRATGDGVPEYSSGIEARGTRNHPVERLRVENTLQRPLTANIGENLLEEAAMLLRNRLPQNTGQGYTYVLNPDSVQLEILGVEFF